jgi:5-methylcytosine-specific restriction protein A
VRGKPYCPDHQVITDRQHEQQRGSRHERGYGNEWMLLSRSVIQRDGGICYLCGLPGADTADHVVPKADGGPDDPSNLAAAHRSCNSAKGKR